MHAVRCRIHNQFRNRQAVRSAGLGRNGSATMGSVRRQVCGEILFPKFDYVMIHVTGNRIKHEKVMMRRPAAVIV